MLERIPTVRHAIGGNKDTMVRRSSRSKESTCRDLLSCVFIYCVLLLRQGTHDPVLGLYLLPLLMKESEVCLLVLLTGQYKPCR